MNMQVTPVNQYEEVGNRQEITQEKLAHLLAENQNQVEARISNQRILLTGYLPVWKKMLLEAYQFFNASSAKELAFSRAGEWILDNYYLIEQTFHEIEQDLPNHYFDQLPKVIDNSENNFPRTFLLAWELIEYNQCLIDIQVLIPFLQDYQQVTPLKIGELWAIPSMFRLGILGKLAGVYASVMQKDVPDVLRIATILPEPGSIAEEIIVTNCFFSLRLFTSTDWKSFFEQTSRVEKLLNDDPVDIYTNMDFDSRNRYRTVIEDLARYSRRTEEEVTNAAIDLAKIASGDPLIVQVNKDRQSHVGYYLIDKGLPVLERQIGYEPKTRKRIQRWILNHPTLVYVGGINFLGFLFLSAILAYAFAAGCSILQMGIIGLLGSALALEISVNLVNWILTHTLEPRTLPRMDFINGIPAAYKSMVVIPSIVGSVPEIQSLLQQIELHFLSNPDPQLSFALLFDFIDAPEKVMPEDEQLLKEAIDGINRLNQKYSEFSPFYLFHRERKWNQSEGVWMGWERKRGKLIELNRLILGDGENTITTKIGKLDVLSRIRFVITLDSDTSTPQGSAKRLVATLAHPLNKALFSEDGHIVTSGYTLLQPRVEIKPTSANRSLFAQIYSGDTGFDLYTLAISDVYQDLFGEGIYVGKGIYDVAAFEKSLSGKVMENTLLSHDLFEGLNGRAALVSDIVFYEDYPARYLVHTRRLRRWIRGDWQLLPWLFSNIQEKDGKVESKLSTIDRWKIFDNLRRSLIAPFTLALFVFSILFIPGSSKLLTLFILLIPGFNLGAQIIHTVSQNLIPFSAREILKGVKFPLIRWMLSILFLPYEALINIKAIAVTLFRLFIDRKRLLQWTTAAHFSHAFKNTTYQTWLEMAPALIFNVTLGFAILIFRSSSVLLATPLLVAWMVSPAVAYWLSQPIINEPIQLSEPERQHLQRLARRTWAYFEHFVGPDDHWLPPDHFQENPHGNVAHYTTPTNIGLYLVAALSAYDLGFIGLFELTVRLRNTFDNMQKLDRYRGHWLNWYDTKAMTPLPPRYVSTVDSGNLAASLIILKEGCTKLKDASLFSKQQWQGLLVTLDLLAGIIKDFDENADASFLHPFQEELENVCRKIISVQDSPQEWTDTFLWLSSDGWYRISSLLIELLESAPSNLDQELLGDLQLYLDTLHQQLISMQRSLKLLTPWFARIHRPPRIFAQNINSTSSIAWRNFLEKLPKGIPTLIDASDTFDRVLVLVKDLRKELNQIPTNLRMVQEAQDWCRRFENDLVSAKTRTEALLSGFLDLAGKAEEAVFAMDFKFLFDQQRQVFHIGYNAGTERLDNSYYDLLASEARLASLVAIAKGDVSQQHWLHLGRPVTKVDGKEVLLSWSGTMFEYLMPGLFCRNYNGTFLSESCYSAVLSQIAFGHEKKIPWGISESGFYSFDAAINYQYRAFGMPNLGYKRDLPDDIVITPYASLIGLSLKPVEVHANLDHFERIKMLGRYGLYEAIDYTKSRLPAGKDYGIVQSYMAHHQGMIMISLCNYLQNESIIDRFHAEEHIQSVELLLQEKIPDNPHIEFPHPEDQAGEQHILRPTTITPWLVSSKSPIPQVHILGSGNYNLMITSGGGGFSQLEEFALTRWHADSTLDDWGNWIYIKDMERGNFWSAACQPVGCVSDSQQVTFFPHKVEFHRWDNDISLHVDITVGREDIEIRRVNIHNDSDYPRRLKVFSYGEVVLAQPSTDRRHPAFNKLFIESEFLVEQKALVFSRRPRSANENLIFLVHALIGDPGSQSEIEYESDRAKFLGRGRTFGSPGIMDIPESRLSKSIGETLDPIFSLAQQVYLKPHSRAQLVFLTLAAKSKSILMERLERYSTTAMINRTFDEARAYSEIELSKVGMTPDKLEEVQQLLSALLFPSEILRGATEILEKNNKGQSGLWTFGISGDYPILLIHIQDAENPMLLQAITAYTYWRNHKIQMNLVILNDEDTGYALDLHNQLLRQLAHLGADIWLNQREGIFLLRSDQIPEQDKALLETVATVILDPKKGTFSDHIKRLAYAPIRLPAFIPSLTIPEDPEPTPSLITPTSLLMDNNSGGFSPDGKEYLINLKDGQQTPHPWINVVANPHFGFLVSESGSGYTWSENSGENRLTPWQNDPISDKTGEALYMRDEETGITWSPTPLPAGDRTIHLIRHGAGYSVFESQSHGLNQLLRLFVHPKDPVKFIHLRLKNLWKRPRRITATYYAEWVLGTTREATQPFIVPEYEPSLNALLAVNRYNTEFSERTAFLASNKKPHGLTTDRNEFLGRDGKYNNPAALRRIGLASTIRAGLDPCAAIQIHVDLEPGQSEDVFFLLGEGSSGNESKELIKKYQKADSLQAVWEQVRQEWDERLGTISVTTPDEGMNIMLNRWLLYQTISCRLWGRSALYQSSGAFGFRDQLQDVMAILHSAPEFARDHILHAASKQFEAGDVLHWWHPPSGRGVRTRISDDLLWLPYVVSEYVVSTGDNSILNEKVSFLKGAPLSPEELERYSYYESTVETYTLFEHCKRALERGSSMGPHGLPLMGTGDWNDGMNLVGAKGKGESVWLGWFLYATLMHFVVLCKTMRDDPKRYLLQAEKLSKAIDAQAWDGDWYLRAFYDDGSKLGSRMEPECSIDSIAQSWAVLSGAANPHRAAYAVSSLEQRLIDDKNKLILLLTPPFNKTRRNPGYIKGYPPGVRENGGQYTHASVWAAWAIAKLGNGDRAVELFQLLNPINHSDTPEKSAQYKVEPYCLAADIYGVAPLTGRGGWTWYTGSAGWMYRFGIEAILGISREGNSLIIEPCIPANWPGFQVNYRFGNSIYAIHVENPQKLNRGVKDAWFDGEKVNGNCFNLVNDGKTHEVRIIIGTRTAQRK
jgi:cyclic beta-1,2-glucan synthetase